MKNLTCKIFGHNFDDNILYNEAWYICKRCDYECEASGIIEHGLIPEIKYYVQRFLSRLKYGKLGSWIRYKLRGKNALPF